MHGPSIIPRVLKGGRRRQQRRSGSPGVGRIQFAVADCEDAGRGHEESRWPLEAGKGKEIDFPLEPPEGTQPCIP